MSSPIAVSVPSLPALVVGNTVTAQVSATDATSGTLTYTAVGLPPGLTLNSSTGAISGTLASAASAIGFFATTITVSNGSYSTTQEMDISVAATGSVTLATPSNQTSDEGTSPTLTLSASGSGTLTYFAVGLPAGMSIDSSSGVISGTIAVNDAAYGPYTVTVLATNGTSFAAAQFLWTITKPISIDSIADQTDNEGDSISLTIPSISIHHEGSGTLTFSAINLPTGLSVDKTYGTISGNVAIGSGASGPYNITLLVNDGTYSSSLNFVINVVAPITITQLSGQTNSEGDTVSLSLTATDTASGTMMYSATGLAPGLSINSSTGVISGVIAGGAAAFGTYSTVVTVSDGTFSTSETLNWNANNLISVAPMAPQNFKTGESVNFTIPATNLGSGTLYYSASELPSGLSINSTTGAITGTIGTLLSNVGDFVSNFTVTNGSSSFTQWISWNQMAPPFNLNTVLLSAPGGGGTGPMGGGGGGAAAPKPKEQLKVNQDGNTLQLEITNVNFNIEAITRTLALNGLPNEKNQKTNPALGVFIGTADDVPILVKYEIKPKLTVTQKYYYLDGNTWVEDNGGKKGGYPDKAANKFVDNTTKKTTSYEGTYPGATTEKWTELDSKANHQNPVVLILDKTEVIITMAIVES